MQKFHKNHPVRDLLFYSVQHLEYREGILQGYNDGIYMEQSAIVTGGNRSITLRGVGGANNSPAQRVGEHQ